MAEAKKKELDDPINVKIQRRFDLVFGGQKTKEVPSHNSNSTVLNHSLDTSFDLTRSNFIIDERTTTKSIDSSEREAIKLSLAPESDGDELNFDLGETTSSISVAAAPAAPAVSAPAAPAPASEDATNMLDALFAEAFANFQNEVMADNTQKTIVYDKEEAKNVIADSTVTKGNELELGGSLNMSIDQVSSEEAKANIEATIQDIVRPKNFDATQGIDMLSVGSDDSSSEFEIENGTKTSQTSSVGFEFNNEPVESSTPMNLDSATGEFDLNSVNFSEKTDTDVEVPDFDMVPADFSKKPAAPASPQSPQSEDEESLQDFEMSAVEFADKDTSEEKAIFSSPTQASYSEPGEPVFATQEMHTINANASYVSDEESTRVQATIRQLREERETLLAQIKNAKMEARELEQDNLTLKAALDESKIEISILRKRHMVELEDMKYRIAINEEKKAMAIEQARLAESKREKLEQRVRIDFNQVKQREKELETKLEMLSIDVDSQVQMRDQKILELRRKIDSLEFNMENVSIKEQKSEDDKRKLEDKLTKIMKTLRHSIKNLEDDIDQATGEDQDDRINELHRSSKNIKYE